jgi:hypothetical protein
MWWFAASHRRATPKGQTFISCTAPCRKALSTNRTPLHVRGTRRFSFHMADGDVLTSGCAEFSSKWRTRFSHLRGGSYNRTVVQNSMSASWRITSTLPVDSLLFRRMPLQNWQDWVDTDVGLHPIFEALCRGAGAGLNGWRVIGAPGARQRCRSRHANMSLSSENS